MNLWPKFKWNQICKFVKKKSFFPHTYKLNSVCTRHNNIFQERQFVLLFITWKVLDISQEIPVLGGFQQTCRAESFRLKHRLESECGQYSKSHVSDFWGSTSIHAGSFSETFMTKVWEGNQANVSCPYITSITGILKIKIYHFLIVHYLLWTRW